MSCWFTIELDVRKQSWIKFEKTWDWKLKMCKVCWNCAPIWAINIVVLDRNFLISIRSYSNSSNCYRLNASVGTAEYIWMQSSNRSTPVIYTVSFRKSSSGASDQSRTFSRGTWISERGSRFLPHNPLFTQR